MSLNREPKFHHPRTFQYDKDGAKAWAAMVKYATRKFNYSGKVNPEGGLVDITMIDGTIRSVEFHNRRPDDDTAYHSINPKVYNGETWVPANEYVCKQCWEWSIAHTPNERSAGHMPDVTSETHHHGKFPPIQRWIDR